VRILTWHHPMAASWRRRTATWPAVRWWALPLAVLYGFGALGAASPTWGVAATPAAHAPSQAMADGHAAFQRGDFPGAALRWQEAARLYAEAKQPQARSVALTHLARAYEALGHADRAEDGLRTALPLAETTGDQAQAALILGHLGELALSAGHVTEAERLVREALGRAQAVEDAGLTATLWQTQGSVFMAQQHWPNALAAYRDSARLAQQAAHWGIAARPRRAPSTAVQHLAAWR
jgi:tetratricopeptide (TPR) repeat protein